jgi:hypothetical protein
MLGPVGADNRKLRFKFILRQFNKEIAPAGINEIPRIMAS